MRGSAKILALISVAAGLTGCGVTSLPATLGVTLPAASFELQDPPIEIYSRIARGALSCWFGAQGSMKKTHVFHADVPPEPAGGPAEITIHERDDSAQNPRAIRAYRIIIGRSGDGSAVATENFRLPPQVATDLTADIGRWAKADQKCSLVGAGGWDAKPGRDEPSPAPASLKKKGR